ncbi:MAG: IS91 family transposase [Chloroflexi bacterium]|nr:IS91 family transposase [Chloroflexota bacterium]
MSLYQGQNEVADVLKRHWLQVKYHAHINAWQLRTLGAIIRCRTADMGGHVDKCLTCGTIRISYNSCRNRHCPKCQGKNREEWIQNRESELLPVPYFHVVFTLPDLLNPLAMNHPKEVYDALFETAWQTIKIFGFDPKYLGGATGMICILHTWGQTMTLHPHLHCIVPGGGLSKSGQWKTALSKGKYLFPVKAMSKVFRAKYMEGLKRRIGKIDKTLVNDLFRKEWVVYAKRPFCNPQAVIEYIGRYTHKIAISNHRITAIDNDTVTFTYKDYRKGAQKQEMTLQGIEFIRRFAMHILPRGFVRIRHYGILSSTSKGVTIPIIKKQIPVQYHHCPEARSLSAYNPKMCPCCKKETMVTIETIPKRGPPLYRQQFPRVANQSSNF